MNNTTTTTPVNIDLSDIDFMNTYVIPLVEKYRIDMNGTPYTCAFDPYNANPITICAIPSIKQAVIEIPRLIRHRVKRDPRDGVGSYGGKHVIEAYRRYTYTNVPAYISNGIFMIAMLLNNFYPVKWENNINQLFDAVYKCKELREFDYDEFKTNIFSKITYTDDHTKRLSLSSIDFEYPKQLHGCFEQYFITKITGELKKEFKKNNISLSKKQFVGVEWSGKFVSTYTDPLRAL